MVTPQKAQPQFVFGSSNQNSSPLGQGANYDLTNVDPALGVIIKGLQKRDAVTRARASDELLSYLQSEDALEDEAAKSSFISTWISLYGSLAIDTDRKVRASSHVILGHLIQKFQKKTVKFLPKVAALWLIGQYDSDRSVSRTAIEAFEAAFPTETKRSEFLRIFADSVYDKCYEFVMVTDVAGLSDARFVNLEDSQAKYNNVVGGAEDVIASLVSSQNLDPSRQRVLLADTRLWKSLSTDDASMQRRGLRLLFALSDVSNMSDCRDAIQSNLGTLISKTLISNTSVLTDFLIAIANCLPTILFVSQDTSKKSIPNRLHKFAQQSTGPGLPEDYWGKMAQLLELAISCPGISCDSLMNLIEAFDKGSRQATKLQGIAATAAFNQVCVTYIIADNSHSKTKFLDRFSHELGNGSTLSTYAVPLATLYIKDRELVMSILRSLSDQVLNTFKAESGSAISTAYQWSDVMSQLSVNLDDSNESILQLQREVVSAALRKEDLSAAQYLFICHIFQVFDMHALLRESGFLTALTEFAKNLPPHAFHEPEHTIKIIECLVHLKEIRFSPTTIISSILEKELSHADAALPLLRLLLHNNFKDCPEAFHAWFNADLDTGSRISNVRWNIYMSYLHRVEPNPAFVDSIHVLASAVLTENASSRATDLLRLMTIHADNADQIETLDDGTITKLARSPWILFECATAVEVAASILPFLKSGCQRLVTASRLEFLERIAEANEKSVKISPLCAIAAELGSQIDLTTPALIDRWQVAMLEASALTLPQELSILHPIGVLSQFVNCQRSYSLVNYDSEGYSSLARILLVLITSQKQLSMKMKFDLLVCMELVMVKSQHHEASRVTSSQKDSITLSTMLTSSWQVCVDDMADALQSTNESLMVDMVNLARHDDRSSFAYYKALAFYGIACCMRERGAPATRIGELYQICSNDLFLLISFSSALNAALLHDKNATFQRNKLASELSGKIKAEGVLESLVKLNGLIPQEPQPSEIMPRQRIIFLVKALLNHRQTQHFSEAILQQMLTLISRVIPSIAKEYGSFWRAIIDWTIESLESRLQSTQNLPMVYTTLRMAAWLMANHESNDDLSEFWLTSRKQWEPLIAKTFIECSLSATEDQASVLCTLVAARLARTIPAASVESGDKVMLSALLCSEAEHIQLTAYALHTIVSEQEREAMVMTSALAKEFDDIDVELPLELASIAVECPLVDEDSFYDLPSPMPAKLRGYCMAWILMFKFFEQSPMRMRLKLVDDLQRLDLLESLLGFIFLALRLLDTKPVDVSKISKAELGANFETGSGELTSYACHLYYLALVHTPALVRSWWIDCKDRLLSAAVESLTEKHYSILLIQRDVQTLQGKQSADLLKDANLTINVSNAGRDIFTTYEIDEQKMEMAIRLPSNYPLRRVVVEGLQRIGVKDAQWRAWLLASQAVLTAQNGTILDAVSLFQRNVSLHFEGVADCNICFSVLSVTDKSLPSKKCQTCKNLFHSSCLFKWFKSSSQSRCPLCRTSFAF